MPLLYFKGSKAQVSISITVLTFTLVELILSILLVITASSYVFWSFFWVAIIASLGVIPYWGLMCPYVDVSTNLAVGTTTKLNVGASILVFVVVTFHTVLYARELTSALMLLFITILGLFLSRIHFFTRSVVFVRVAIPLLMCLNIQLFTLLGLLLWNPDPTWTIPTRSYGWLFVIIMAYLLLGTAIYGNSLIIHSLMPHIRSKKKDLSLSYAADSLQRRTPRELIGYILPILYTVIIIIIAFLFCLNKITIRSVSHSFSSPQVNIQRYSLSPGRYVKYECFNTLDEDTAVVYFIDVGFYMHSFLEDSPKYFSTIMARNLAQSIANDQDSYGNSYVCVIHRLGRGWSDAAYSQLSLTEYANHTEETINHVFNRVGMAERDRPRTVLISEGMAVIWARVIGHRSCSSKFGLVDAMIWVNGFSPLQAPGAKDDRNDFRRFCANGNLKLSPAKTEEIPWYRELISVAYNLAVDKGFVPADEAGILHSRIENRRQHLIESKSFTRLLTECFSDTAECNNKDSHELLDQLPLRVVYTSTLPSTFCPLSVTDSDEELSCVDQWNCYQRLLSDASSETDLLSVASSTGEKLNSRILDATQQIWRRILELY